MLVLRKVVEKKQINKKQITNKSSFLKVEDSFRKWRSKAYATSEWLEESNIFLSWK